MPLATPLSSLQPPSDRPTPPPGIVSAVRRSRTRHHLQPTLQGTVPRSPDHGYTSDVKDITSCTFINRKKETPRPVQFPPCPPPRPGPPHGAQHPAAARLSPVGGTRREAGRPNRPECSSIDGRQRLPPRGPLAARQAIARLNHVQGEPEAEPLTVRTAKTRPNERRAAPRVPPPRPATCRFSRLERFQ